jgi:hypothetical protein
MVVGRVLGWLLQRDRLAVPGLGVAVHNRGKPTAGQPRGGARTEGATRARRPRSERRVNSYGWVGLFCDGRSPPRLPPNGQVGLQHASLQHAPFEQEKSDALHARPRIKHPAIRLRVVAGCVEQRYRLR